MIPSSLLCADAKCSYLPDLLRTPQHRRENPSTDHVKRKTTSQLTLHYSFLNNRKRRAGQNLQHKSTYIPHNTSHTISTLARIIMSRNSSHGGSSVSMDHKIRLSVTARTDCVDVWAVKQTAVGVGCRINYKGQSWACYVKINIRFINVERMVQLTENKNTTGEEVRKAVR